MLINEEAMPIDRELRVGSLFRMWLASAVGATIYSE